MGLWFEKVCGGTRKEVVNTHSYFYETFTGEQRKVLRTDMESFAISANKMNFGEQISHGFCKSAYLVSPLMEIHCIRAATEMLSSV